MVTGRCNFRCFFCHMEGYKEGRSAEEELSLEEIEILAAAGKRLSIEAYKITGGEPTLREDLPDIVEILKSYGRPYVSMTTNASYLHKHIGKLSEHGLDHINVSLHAASPSTFEKVTGAKLFSRVIENLQLAREYGIRIKINFVVLRNLNVGDLERLIDLAAKLDATLQLIELHPVGKARFRFRDHHLPRWRVLEMLEERIVEIRYRLGLHNRPVLLLDNGVRVELVGPVGNYLFCSACTRMRVTYDFKILPCLNWRGKPVDVRGRLRASMSFEEKVEAVIDAIREANSLRRPTFLFPARDGIPLPARRRAPFRLGIAKRDGSLDLLSKKELDTASWYGYTEAR
jgi:cyclic pyranopterin phosphate synthase